MSLGSGSRVITMMRRLGSWARVRAAVAGGAIVLLAGFIILLMAVVYALSMVMAPWLAALIVGVVVMIIGFAMLQSGKKQFEPSHFKPDRTLDALNKDQEALRRKVS